METRASQDGLNYTRRFLGETQLLCFCPGSLEPSCSLPFLLLASFSAPCSGIVHVILKIRNRSFFVVAAPARSACVSLGSVRCFLVCRSVGESCGLLASAERDCPHDDEDIEEDERNCVERSVVAWFFPVELMSSLTRAWKGQVVGWVNSLRISVRTEFMRLIVFALTLAPSWAPPKEGSFCAALPQPTVLVT